MGMFDGQGMNQAPSSLADMYRGVGRSIGKGFLDPYMESKGFISQENQILEVMKDVDLNDPASYSEGFRKIMEINPQAAAEFRSQTMPLLQANLEAQSLNLEQQRLDAASTLKETGTPLNKAQENRRKELIKEFGEAAGNAAFRQEIQAEKLAVETAAEEKRIGTELWAETNDSRSETAAKINQIETNIKLYNEAKNKGNPAAGALAENALTAIFEGSGTRAASEIQRLATAGSLPQRAANLISELFIDGTKTDRHYNAVIEVLEYFKRDNELLYNEKTSKIQNYNKIYKLSLPENQLKFMDISEIKTKTEESNNSNVIVIERDEDGKLIRTNN